MDPMLALEIEECRKNELCESRIFSIWEGTQFFQMQAYNDPQKFINLLWSFEVLAFATSVQTISEKSNGNTTLIMQTFAQVLVNKYIVFQKKADLISIDLANMFIEKTTIPRVLFSIEKFSKEGGLAYSNLVTLTGASITAFKGKQTLKSSRTPVDLVTLSFKDFK